MWVNRSYLDKTFQTDYVFKSNNWCVVLNALNDPYYNPLSDSSGAASLII